jgi:zona occludens toxin (predicted ATPase)
MDQCGLRPSFERRGEEVDDQCSQENASTRRAGKPSFVQGHGKDRFLLHAAGACVRRSTAAAPLSRHYSAAAAQVTDRSLPICAPRPRLAQSKSGHDPPRRDAVGTKYQMTRRLWRLNSSGAAPIKNRGMRLNQFMSLPLGGVASLNQIGRPSRKGADEHDGGAAPCSISN